MHHPWDDHDLGLLNAGLIFFTMGWFHRKKRVRFYEPHVRESKEAFISLPEQFQDFAEKLDGQKRSLDDILAEMQRIVEDVPGAKVKVIPPREGYIQVEYREGGFRAFYSLIKFWY